MLVRDSKRQRLPNMHREFLLDVGHYIVARALD